MDLKLRGKAALVSGSSRGIGLATAKAFSRRGVPDHAVGALDRATAGDGNASPQTRTKRLVRRPPSQTPTADSAPSPSKPAPSGFVEPTPTATPPASGFVEPAPSSSDPFAPPPVRR
jgi:hypothetical protein